MQEDRTYNIRVSFKHGNAITLDLKGCGSLYIKPYKDYYFINAPINFINYLAQLKRVGIEYTLTSNKRGCYQEIDLTQYNYSDPRYILASLRKPLITEPVETVKEERPVVLTSDDVVVKEAKIETPVVTEEITEPIIEEVTNTEETVEEETEEINNEPQETEESVVEITYTEEELTKMSKTKLLEIASSLNLTNVSDINTKKEIREAILKATL